MADTRLDLECECATACVRFMNGVGTAQHEMLRVRRSLEANGWTFAQLESGTTIARPPERPSSINGFKASPIPPSLGASA